MTTHVEQVIERELPDLLAYFTRRVRPVEDAADLLSETLVVLWRRADAVPEEPEAARRWAFGVARKVLATHRRTLRRRAALTDRLRDELSVPNPDGDGDATAALHDALLTLRPLDREIVRLVHWDGFSLVDAAAVLGRRPATVRSRYHRARQALRRRLVDQGALKSVQ
ncbi:RNA polymerase sigma factor [Nocardioides lianchengensis]|uniref:RNA polymerase sigma-70 factor, ECF subfamily n=1 Tax=Nocardioides lianchengensis TaxID=1045774 RepID=A0A1G6LWG1_9ACTN|nr:sigma-70 family RNA polymerase sigma factor [Nocardioides lianchengensis]NYG12423.1 RNA polymerase sigma-70 factor (ECF subfamily) [Nocardioides lianchengensis]SDC47603.1 RNA polymerase sigma-70 factor, ECF subfamily [Nocardioides lianchengensis]